MRKYFQPISIDLHHPSLTPGDPRAHTYSHSVTSIARFLGVIFLDISPRFCYTPIIR